MMTQNATNEILMVRPVRFGMNAETAVDNHYQQVNQHITDAAHKAIQEFDNFVQLLQEQGVHVHVLQDTAEPHTPDSIFPNNWLSMHADGTVCLYPMKAENRRLERIQGIEKVLQDWGFEVGEVADFTSEERCNTYLEGTGALIFDHDSRLVYMARSQRADEGLMRILAEKLGYDPVIFSAYQSVNGQRLPIYHTNVMMCVTDQYVVICLDCIDDPSERDAVRNAILNSGKEVLELTEQQVEQFAGNMLLVKGDRENLFLVMSSSARTALTMSQLELIEKHHTIIHASLPTIETLGGGSARCMLAEIYLPNKKS